MTPVRVIPSRLDPSLRAELGAFTPLRYTTEIAASADIPSYVRSASAIRRWRQHLAIVQDDVLALAMLDARGEVEPLLLPSQQGLRTFDATRANKQAKPDLEAAIVLPDERLVLFDSGASAARERVFVVAPNGHVRLIVASDWYDRLRAEPAFCGAELNLEGAVISRDCLMLFQRANGPAGSETAAVSATGEVPMDAFVQWLDRQGATPELVAIRQYELGAVAGVLMGFTDACVTVDGRIAFVACAEDSPDAIADGPIVATRFGIIDGDDVRMTDIVGPDGKPSLLKLEGIEPRPGESLVYDVVADIDDPGAAALLATLEVR